MKHLESNKFVTSRPENTSGRSIITGAEHENLVIKHGGILYIPFTDVKDLIFLHGILDIVYGI